MSTYATKLIKWVNIIDATTEQGKKTQADTEKANFEFSQIPNSDYLSLEDTAKDYLYVLSKTGKGTDQKVICSCEYFKESGNICEHIIAMKDVDLDKLDATEEYLISYLRSTKWHDDENGRFMPPDPDDDDIDVVPVIDAEIVPPPDGEKHVCKVCGKEYDSIDGVLNCIEEHEKPPAQKSKTVPDHATHECEYCGGTFNTDDLLNHIEECKRKHVEAKAVEKLPALIENMDWTAAEVETMRKTVADKATIEEFAYFLNVAKAVDLNPFLKEIYFMKTEKGQVAVITGRDGFLKIAKRDPNFEGVFSMEVCEKDEFTMSFDVGKDGRMHQTINHKIIDFNDRGNIIGAWAQAQTRGVAPVVAYATRKEYDRKKDIWSKFPAAMMRKVPESMVLRRIAGISGVAGEAEIGNGTIIETNVEVM